MFWKKIMIPRMILQNTTLWNYRSIAMPRQVNLNMLQAF